MAYKKTDTFCCVGINLNETSDAHREHSAGLLGIVVNAYPRIFRSCYR